MDVKAFFDSMLLMLVLFNPLLMSVYLHDVMASLDSRTFINVISRAFLISAAAFAFFAWAGERFFVDVIQVRFAAFLIFGGLVFFVIAVRYIVFGAQMLGELRGDATHLSGSIAMPFMIGPGTVSASVLVGLKLPVGFAWLAIAVSLIISCLLLIAVKFLFNYVKLRNEQLLQRYLEAIGRASALIIGTIAVDMILKGIDLWRPLN
ncbi:MarC family protein [Stieleria varia]|uniref:UPF0056 membrane protein n=1 Tax=Stieleria varia TaxID=2528005 RepID=A0A5C6A434_9BACT|nr:MarC family protein [Stieleria varia]TWT94672.1 putative antibiotic transporter [Stieleria varia]